MTEPQDPTEAGWAAPGGGPAGPPGGPVGSPPPDGGALPPPPPPEYQAGYPQGGYPPPGYDPAYAVQPKTPGVVITGFVLALIGILIAGIPLGIAAIVCGIVGLTKITSSGGALKGKGLAIAAIVIGPIDIILAIIILASRAD